MKRNLVYDGLGREGKRREKKGREMRGEGSCSTALLFWYQYKVSYFEIIHAFEIIIINILSFPKFLCSRTVLCNRNLVNYIVFILAVRKWKYMVLFLV